MTHYYLFREQTNVDDEYANQIPALYAGMFTDLMEACINAEAGDYLFILNPDTWELEQFARAYQERHDTTRSEWFWLYGWELVDGTQIEYFQEHMAFEPVEWVVTEHIQHSTHIVQKA